MPFNPFIFVTDRPDLNNTKGARGPEVNVRRWTTDHAWDDFAAHRALKGRRKYGCPLTIGNGGHATKDGLEEIDDALKYMVKARAEDWSREDRELWTRALGQLVGAARKMGLDVK